MRICSILTSLTSGGAEMLVANLNGQFLAQGHTSVVIALCDAQELGNSPETELRLRRQIEAEGGQFISLGLRRRRGLLAGTMAMRAALLGIRPDVIHAHTARALPMLATGVGKTPLVLTHHNSRLSFPPILFRLFDRQVSAYVAITPEVKRLFARHTSRPIVHIPNAAGAGFGVDCPRDKAGVPAKILSVGAVSPQKNYGLLLQVAKALREIAPALPQPIFTVAGNGPDIASLRQAAQALGLDGQVMFLGERSDVSELMRDADLYLNTSLYEGMPVALLEAMAMALPIVATDVAGNRELVQHEATGLLAGPDEPAALAACLVRLLTEPGLYRRQSSKALAHSGRYSLPAAAARHLRLYAEAAAWETAGLRAPGLCSEG